MTTRKLEQVAPGHAQRLSKGGDEVFPADLSIARSGRLLAEVSKPPIDKVDRRIAKPRIFDRRPAVADGRTGLRASKRVFACAITRVKQEARSVDGWPLPHTQSYARARMGASAASSSQGAAEYRGLKPA